MTVRLQPGRAYAKADALLMTMAAGELTSWLLLTFACATGRFSDEGLGQRSTQINPSIEQTGAAHQYFGHTSLRLRDHQGIHNARRNPIEAGKNQTIEIAEGEPLRRFSSLHIELVAQR